MATPDAAVDVPTVPLGPEDPRQLGSYTLIGKLGQGGMGTVYLGRSETGRLVAIKVIRADVADDDEFRTRFRLEADTARRVARVCTAEVLDAAPDAEQPYLVTEFIEGRTLAKFVSDGGPLSAANLEQLAVGVAAALTAIHGAGIVHRDLKPSNVVLSPFGPRVIDFGIARALDSVSNLTGDLQQLGTPAFMAPEQIEGAAITSAVDIFAWGGLVTFAATGRYPFGEASAQVLLYRAVNEQPRLDGLDDSLREIVESAMAKDPSVRPSAQQLMLRLLGEPTATGPIDPEATVTQVLRDWKLPAPGSTRTAGDRSGVGGMTLTPTSVGADTPPPPSHRAVALVVAGAGVAGVAVLGAVLALSSHPSGTGGVPVADIMPRSTQGLDDDTFVYMSEQSGNRDIWSVRVGPDGRPAEQHQLTTGAAQHILPVIVPKRRTVIYTVGGSSPSLAAIAADGSSAPMALFTTGPAAGVRIAPDARATVDPDGKFVVIKATAGPNGGGAGLYKVAIDGSSVKKLPVQDDATDPSWSPLGNRIVYFVPVGDVDGGALFTIDPNKADAKPTQLTDGAQGFDADPCWSPDGKRIAFRRAFDPGVAEMDIFVMDAGGGTATRLTHARGRDQDPSFAAGDTKRIAFSSQRDGGTNPEIYVTNANQDDDANARKLTSFAGLDATPRWTSG
ncbi:protein kinase [Frankia sp. Cppng1_Ct_nod]|uniref:protein kinase domain-containing protein n=1 Tax=Frankia sp. Cppng1_Ct_nod TaxID=2897162 RepID=UPI002024C964|nr:protein kinase [Frankia sp. Cppng1_Ct_nod]